MANGTNCIAVCGAGVMASGMVRHLVARGFRVQLYNRTRANAEHLRGDFCELCESPSRAASDASAIISCVSDDGASESMWFDREGLLRGAARGALAIETSTLSISYTDRWVRRVREAGLVPADAPITGSKKGIEAGAVTAFIGVDGDPDPVSRILGAFSAKCIHFGQPGMGMRFKMAYNAIGAGIGTAFAEGLALLDSLGVDLDLAVQTLRNTGWAGLVAESKGDNMVNRTYLPSSFKAALMLKDLRYALECGVEVGARQPLTQAVALLYEELIERGLGEWDFSVIGDAFPRPGQSETNTL